MKKDEIKNKSFKSINDSDKKNDNNMFKAFGNHKNILEEQRKSLISRESKGRDRGSLFNLNESLKKHEIENETEINNMSLMDQFDRKKSTSEIKNGLRTIQSRQRLEKMMSKLELKNIREDEEEKLQQKVKDRLQDWNLKKNRIQEEQLKR